MINHLFSILFLCAKQLQRGRTVYVLCFCISACSTAVYQPRPIEPEQISTDFEQKSIENPSFQSYLRDHGYPASTFPIKAWDAETLSLAAFYFHPSIQVAKQQLVVAEQEQAVSRLNNAPSVSGSIGRSDDVENPWIYGLSLSIPLSTNNKQSIKLESASHLKEAARISIGESMWQLRQNVHTHWLNYHYHTALLSYTQNIADDQRALLAMLEKRLAHGLTDKGELSYVQIALLQTQQNLAQAAQQAISDKLKLAEAIGLPSQQFSQLYLGENIYKTPTTIAPVTMPAPDVQAKTVLNRLDIRAALARYAAQEAKLKLEYANQIPDITLGPSYSYEEGLNFWSLGITTLLKLAKNNDVVLARAQALRDLEAAQFEVIQTTDIQQAEQARQQMIAAISNFQQSLKLHEEQTQLMQQQQKSFDAGNIDRYTLTQQKLAMHTQTMTLLNLAHQIRLSTLALENAMQAPLSSQLSLPLNIINEVAR